MNEDKTYVIAIDFDGTLVTGGWPDISQAKLINDTVWRMQEQLRKNPNTAFVLWTCRVEDKLDDAKRFIKEHDLPIFYFNENHPSVFTWMEGAKHTRKIYANEYWDDRAVKVGQYQEFGGKQ